VKRPFLALLLFALWGSVRAASAQQEVPIQIAGRVIFLKGTVNGQGPLTFILDTGATETVLTPRAAQRLGIVGRPSPGEQQKSRAGAIAVGDATVRDLPIRVFDPPQALPLRLDQGVDYNGLLGYTFLERFITSIDYRRLRVRFTPLAAQRAQADPAGCTVPFEIRDGLIEAKGYVNGKGPLRLLVDTGSAEILLMPRAARALDLKTSSRPGYPRVGFTTLDSLVLGTVGITNLPAIVHVLPQETTPVAYDGIVGYPFLSCFHVTINYRDRLLTLAPCEPAAPDSAAESEDVKRAVDVFFK
jgi:predicted aspartyl protease